MHRAQNTVPNILQAFYLFAQPQLTLWNSTVIMFKEICMPSVCVVEPNTECKAGFKTFVTPLTKPVTEYGSLCQIVICDDVCDAGNYIT